jgi:tetratricopeptide (TPR) repeat protein
MPLPAQSEPPPAVVASRAEKVFTQARQRFLADTNNFEAAWQFGRSCFDWADCSTTSAKRAQIAEQGIAACRTAIKTDARSVQGHYYLGMNLGQLAQTKELGALWLVNQMEVEFKTALSVDPNFDYAGPDRNLGLLYWQAPGWPASIGNKDKARLHLEAALRIAPRYPENLLNLMEAEVAWGERAAAFRRLRALDDLWPVAQRELTGDDWASSWADWGKRRAELRAKAAAADSPRSPSRK